MTRKHWLLMIAGCGLPVIGLTAVFLLKLQVSSVLLFGLVLLCPVVHLLMLGDHGGRDPQKPGVHDG
ncbi:MAG: hypothetical protein DHS20C20_30040 [Ardenticatenaceae bacterium]|nr:MAG: hypothetical protein DHS20C20_30040 [Ardenticatenaceae bacterium]